MADALFRVLRKHGLPVFFLAFLLLVGGYAIATYEVVMHTPGSSITCGPPPPYLKPLAPWQALFTARILYVGRVDSKSAMQSGHRFGPWAIAHVNHRYWGLPWWSSSIVVIAPGRFQEGEAYFVDGRVGWLPHSRFLPIVSTPACNRTQALSEAVVDTRILNQGPPRTGVRIIGRTYRRRAAGGDERGYEPAPGVRVEIKGPSGSMFVTSDSEAVYDATGLPPGHYSIEIDRPARMDRYMPFEYKCPENLAPGDVWGRPVFTQ